MLLRFLGWDGFVTSRDVVLCLRDAGLDIAETVTSKRDLAKVQAQFNAWAEETGLSYVQLSRICALSIGENAHEAEVGIDPDCRSGKRDAGRLAGQADEERRHLGGQPVHLIVQRRLLDELEPQGLRALEERDRLLGFREVVQVDRPDVLAHDAAALIDHLGLDDYDLVGFSLGSRTSVRAVLAGLAPRRPARSIASQSTKSYVSAYAMAAWFSPSGKC